MAAKDFITDIKFAEHQLPLKWVKASTMANAPTSMGAPVVGGLVVYRFADSGVQINTPAGDNALETASGTGAQTVKTTDADKVFAPIGLARIGNEIFSYSALTTTTMTVAARGLLGTTPAAHTVDSTAIYYPDVAWAPTYQGVTGLSPGISGICTQAAPTALDVERFAPTTTAALDWRLANLIGGRAPGGTNADRNFLIEVQTIDSGTQFKLERKNQTETIALVPGGTYFAVPQADGAYLLDPETAGATAGVAVILAGFDDYGQAIGLTTGLATSGTRSCPVWVKAAVVRPLPDGA